MTKQDLQNKLEQAKNLLIILPSNPTFDKVAAGLALFLSLKKKEKDTNIVCPTKMLAGFNHLIGIDKVADKVGNKNLVVSFDYVGDSIEKVSYNIENDKFNLVIEPKDGLPPLDPEKVSYSLSGSNADTFFLIGVLRFEDLGPIYENLRKVFKERLVVDIDNYQGKTPLSELNFVDQQASSCSQLVIKLLKEFSLPVDSDVATNLFLGIEQNTQGFKTRVTAETFEAAAWCLKNGARKEYRQVPEMTLPQPQSSQLRPSPDWFKPKVYKGSTLS